MLLRPAEPADALDVARVHVRSWQAAYRGILPNAYLDGLKPEDRAPHYDFSHADSAKPHTIVAVEGAAIMGFSTTLPGRDADLAQSGELAALYVDPEHWGRGFGAVLIAAARARLAERGFRTAYLWLLHGNTRADRFYRVDGWVPDGTQKTDSIFGITVNELRYRTGLSRTPLRGLKPY